MGFPSLKIRGKIFPGEPWLGDMTRGCMAISVSSKASGTRSTRVPMTDSARARYLVLQWEEWQTKYKMRNVNKRTADRKRSPVISPPRAAKYFTIIAGVLRARSSMISDRSLTSTHCRVRGAQLDIVVILLKVNA